MDKKLGEFLQACKDRGIYDKMSFILTTDHGMSPFGQRGELQDEYGTSKLDDLIGKIKALNYNVEYLTTGQKPRKDTDIVLVGFGLQVQLSFVGNYTKDDVDRISSQLKGQEYVGNIIDNEQIVQRGGASGFADMIISPKPPYSFKANISSIYIARGQHDSLDDTSQHIISLMWGKNIKKGYKYEERVYNIDFEPTMAKLLEIMSPGQWDGQILQKALEYSQQNDANK
jgi:arylsulfatase A-like enzyme